MLPVSMHARRPPAAGDPSFEGRSAAAGALVFREQRKEGKFGFGMTTAGRTSFPKDEQPLIGREIDRWIETIERGRERERERERALDTMSWFHDY